MITTYAELKPHIIPRLPSGVAVGVLENEIRLACRQFCEDSGRWVQTLDDAAVVADQQDYDLSSLLPDNSEIYRIVWVKLYGSSSVETADYYWLYEEATLRWHEDHKPSTADADGLSVRVALKPDLIDDVLPDWFLTRWRMALAYRVLANLCAMPKKSFTDLEIAGYYETLYQAQLTEAKLERYHRNRSQEIRVKHDQWV